MSLLRMVPLEYLLELLETGVEIKSLLRELAPTEEVEFHRAQIADLAEHYAEELQRRADLTEALALVAGGAG